MPVFFLILTASWATLAFSCRLGFGSLLRNALRVEGLPGRTGNLADRYHRMTGRKKILALGFFTAVVYLGDLKYWLGRLPLFSDFSVFEGAAGLGLFLLFLCTIWYFACPAHAVIFRRLMSRSSFVASNVKLNLPILFPWAVLSFLFDLMSMKAVTAAFPFLAGGMAHVLCFVSVLAAMMVLMPAFIRKWWGCTSLQDSIKGREMVSFLDRSGFGYRDIVRWPIFEGRMMTAAIMGIVPRFRYILVTDSLMEVLSIEELKGVLAHEMGHAKYRHLLVYVVFFIGFIVVSYGASDLVFAVLPAFPSFVSLLTGGESSGLSLFYLLFSIPMLFAMAVYFRFIIGFFMRHFERQADLFAARFLGTAYPVINALEKIAFYSGNTRDLPSWHHFSVRERVDCLLRAERDAGLVRKHNRFVASCFAVYLIFMVSAGYFANLGTGSESFRYRVMEQALLDRAESGPPDPGVYGALAMLYHESERWEDALSAYETALRLEPDNPVTLNNMAWLLSTATERGLRDPVRAVNLAEKAVALERNPVYLDTLAEAYYAAGNPDEAVAVIEEAIENAKDRVGYYREQREKFVEELR
ncbi:MAG TPA: tetratricopeptide repeat protein [Desulfobacteraceae bacterium]|nr:tetratricopeptide repeat protein [Desulfobacteraceae bacterium]